MCDPVLAGAALTALSTGANYMANQKVENARSDALAAERIRQGALDQQADALNLQSQDRFQGIEEKTDERSKSLGEYFTQQQAEAPVASALPASSSNITVANENKARGEARERTNEIGSALGELRSFGDLLGETSRLQARDASQVGQIGGFKKGSSNVLGLELDSANSAGNGLRTFGDVAGVLGKVGLAAGLSGAGGGLGSLFGGAGPVKLAGAVAPSAVGSSVAPLATSKFNAFSLY